MPRTSVDQHWLSSAATAATSSISGFKSTVDAISDAETGSNSCANSNLQTRWSNAVQNVSLTALNFWRTLPGRSASNWANLPRAIVSKRYATLTIVIAVSIPAAEVCKPRCPSSRAWSAMLRTSSKSALMRCSTVAIRQASYLVKLS